MLKQDLIILYRNSHGLFIAIQNNDIVGIKSVLETGFDLNIILKPVHGTYPKLGISPLHFAIESKAPENIIKLLLEYGADLNIQDNNGQTPLHYAGSYNLANIAEILLKEGAEVNIKDKNNYTPLHCCTYTACSKRIDQTSDYYNTIDILLKYGADIDITISGYEEHTPFTIGLFLHVYKAFELFHHYSHYLLQKADKNKLALLYKGAITDNSLGIKEVKSLLEMKIPINNTKPHNILTYAFLYGNYEVIKLLLENGANCKNIVIESWNDRSYLHLAVMSHYNEIVKILLLHDIDIDAIDKSGATALHYAASMGDTEIVTMLLNNDAKTNIITNEIINAFSYVNKITVHSTALDIAKNNNHVEVVRIINSYTSVPKSLVRLSRLTIRTCIKANKRNVSVQQAIHDESVYIPMLLKNYVHNIIV